MSDYGVREARVADIGTILDLAVEMVLASRSHLRPDVADETIRTVRRKNLDQLEAVLDAPEGGIFVAVDDHDRPIGHVILLGNNFDTVTEQHQAWVYDLSVRQEWWGKGVGRRLMAVAEDFARSLGVAWIGLGVTVANERAAAFYEEIGYRPERVQMLKNLEENSKP